MVLGEIKKILGKIRGMGQVTQVEIFVPEKNRILVRNVIGQIKVGDKITLRDGVKEERVLVNRKKKKK
jgi:ribosomal protein S28E/S33